MLTFYFGTGRTAAPNKSPNWNHKNNNKAKIGIDAAITRNCLQMCDGFFFPWTVASSRSPSLVQQFGHNDCSTDDLLFLTHLRWKICLQSNSRYSLLLAVNISFIHAAQFIVPDCSPVINFFHWHRSHPLGRQNWNGMTNLIDEQLEGFVYKGVRYPHGYVPILIRLRKQ